MHSHDAGGCDFPCDPETLADRQSQFWIPSLQPQAVMLSPAPKQAGRDAPLFTLAHLDGLDLRRADDGWHGLWQVDGVAHQFWLPEAVPDAAAFYAVTVPMDAFLELRAHAARRLWRSLNGRAPGPDFRAMPSQMRQLHILSLRALGAAALSGGAAAVRGGATAAGAATAAYSLGSLGQTGAAGVASGLGGVARAAGSAAISPLKRAASSATSQASESVKSSFADGVRTGFGATGGTSSMGTVGGASAAPAAAPPTFTDGPPAWAQRMQRRQAMNHGTTMTAHAVRSGDSRCWRKTPSPARSSCSARSAPTG